MQTLAIVEALSVGHGDHMHREPGAPEEQMDL